MLNMTKRNLAKRNVRPTKTKPGTRRHPVKTKRAVPAQGRSASGGKKAVKRAGYQVNRNFALYDELRSLFIKASPDSFPQIKKDLRRVGRINFALIAGSFLNMEGARVDMLVVGERIDLERLTNFIKDLEAGMGKEIRYVLLSREEFLYRYEMYDRFLRDILDYPHQKIINRLKI